MNQESPTPRRRSNFRAPGSVDAEVLSRVFGETAAADLGAAVPPVASETVPNPAVSARVAGLASVAPPPAAQDQAAVASNDRGEVPSGRRASARPVDEFGPRRRASRRGNRRAAGEAAPTEAAANGAPAREPVDAVSSPGPVFEGTPDDAARVEAASGEIAPIEAASGAPGAPGAPVADAAARAVPAPVAPTAGEAVPAGRATIEHPAPGPSVDEAADPMRELLETALADAAEAEAAPAATALAEPEPAVQIAPPATALTEPAPALAESAPALAESARDELAAPIEPSSPAAPSPAAPAAPEVVTSQAGRPTGPATMRLDPADGPRMPQPSSAVPAPGPRAASTRPRSDATAAFPWQLTPEVPMPVDRGRSSSPAPTRRPRQPRHRLVVGASAAAILVVTGLGAVAVAKDVPTSLFAGTAEGSPPPADAFAGAAEPTVTSDLSEAAAPFTGGTAITVTGEHLDEVAQVSVAGASADILEVSGDRLTFAVPATTGDAIGEAAVVFADGQGRPVTVSVTGASSSAEASAGAASEPKDPSEASDPAAGPAADSLTLTYTSDPGIDAQLAYVLEHWDDYNTAEYPAVAGKDAVNFASQSLVARGWAMDDAWNVDRGTGSMSAAWSSSTALREYLLTRTDRATELTDSRRDEVKVGDLAQFDWDGSGDRDHTAVVTRVERTDAGTKVWVASHTKDADYWDVDAALASGGAVSWFSIR